MPPILCPTNVEIGEDYWLSYEISVPNYTTTPTPSQSTDDAPITLPPTAKSNYNSIWVRTYVVAQQS